MAPEFGVDFPRQRELDPSRLKEGAMILFESKSGARFSFLVSGPSESNQAIIVGELTEYVQDGVCCDDIGPVELKETNYGNILYFQIRPTGNGQPEKGIAEYAINRESIVVTPPDVDDSLVGF